MPRPPAVRIILFITITTISHSQWAASSVSSSSSPSSNLLRLHRRLYSQPAHDKSLYTILGVPTNATAVIIDKAYRKRQLEFHPDKRRQHRRHFDDSNGDSNVDDDDDDAALQKVREAYEILKDDDKRLLYHRFGIIDVTDAVGILSGDDGTRRWGSSSSSSTMTTIMEKDKMLENRWKLLRLMGYGGTTTTTTTTCHSPPPPPPPSSPPDHSRITFIAADLTERLRPLVEGLLTQDQLAYILTTECDRLKTLPLGAQILRCVGRAYRHAGQSYLRRHDRLIATPTKTTTRVSAMAGVREDWRERWRRGKDLLTAVMAGGRYIVTDSVVKRRFDDKKKTDEELLPTIGYHCHDDDSDSESDYTTAAAAAPPSPDDVRQSREEKTRSAVVTALQIEALWKVTKIELDRVVTEACRLILSRDYFFYGMTTTTTTTDNRERRQRRYGGTGRRDDDDDGWVVGSTGRVIESDVACLRVAAALVLLGDIFVRCSKEGTSWRE